MSDRWQDRISEYLDGELTPSETHRFEAHLVECSECRTILSELRELVRQASQLEAPAVPDRVWESVRERIALQGFEEPNVIPMPAPEPVVVRQSSWFSGLRLLAAGLALMIFSASAGYWLRGSHSPSPEPMTASSDADFDAASSRLPSLSLRSLPPELAEALIEYEASAKQLEASLHELADQLDPVVYETLEGNLYTIDRAIHEARVALSSDPQSEYLNAHLADSMMRKVRLLQQVTQLASNQI